MDTGTHFMFGLGLGGLAMVDPVITSHTYGPIAILIGTVAGSNAPDLDGLLRFKSNADYIKNHRGLSHSFPAIIGWAALITVLVSLFFREIPWWHIGFWVLLAVVVHVVSDLFNSYGTQAYRPVSRQWVAWNIIHIFDPFIFSTHLVAILLWISGAAAPQVVFPVLYVLLVVYYVWRTLVHRRLSRKIPKQDPHGQPGDSYTLLPTVSLYRWNLVRQSKDCTFGVGEWDHGRLKWIDVMKCDEHPAIEASKKHSDVQAFLSFTPFPCGYVKPQTWGYEVRWLDVRYRYRRQYPFVAVVLMDLSYAPLQSYVGWLSDERLEKRLRMNTY
ncbi:metal-dependent hydrolase [Cohnella luojiensis]|uniref:Metal-dependent hydrolase n=1 Tax=Cohnella luojiensis TaxID=652876 RepID=A0A4Y8LWS2_9BACL|nr:metal-dependent hydrolase [Cohnella luojiensis]TFE24275.1 metal-dependent hydrolase [Cohnella luojiensis]